MTLDELLKEIKYKDFTKLNYKPNKPEDYYKLLFPLENETAEELFYKKDNLNRILEFLIGIIPQFNIEDWIHYGIIQRCIKLAFTVDNYKLVLEYSGHFQIEKLINYLIVNSKDSTHITRIQTYKSNALVIAMYYLAKDKLDNFTENDSKTFFLIDFLYAGNRNFGFESEFEWNFNNTEFQLDLYALHLKELKKSSSEERNMRLFRMSQFFFEETDLKYVGMSALPKELEQILKEDIPSLKSNKILINLLNFIRELILEKNLVNHLNGIIEILKLINKTNVGKNADFVAKVVSFLMEYFDICLKVESDNEEIDVTDIIQKLVSVICSNNYRVNFILSSITSSNLSDLLQSIYENGAYKEFDDMYKAIYYMDSPEKILNYLHTHLGFECAYVAALNNNNKLAKELYLAELNKKESAAVLNNLAAIFLNEKKYKEALDFINKGLKLDPQHENLNKNLENAKTGLEILKAKPQKMKDYYFKKTDKFQKQMLFTIYKFIEEDNVINKERVREIIKANDNYYFNKKFNDLVVNELIIENNHMLLLDETINSLISDYIDPQMERQVIKGNQNKLYRPIFYHESEINLYRVLIELFPQHLVFPNMDLKTIIDVEKITNQISNEELSYLYKAHVDFAIINTTTYFPIITFEKDSEFNDTERGQSNATMKNHIFEVGGLPLIRIRYNNAMDYERLKEEIKQTTKQLLLETKSGNPTHQLLNEFDLKKFGIFDRNIELEELILVWNNIVGVAIAEKTHHFDFDESQMLLSITMDKNIEMIINIGVEKIKSVIYEKYPQLNKIQFYFNS